MLVVRASLVWLVAWGVAGCGGANLPVVRAAGVVLPPAGAGCRGVRSVGVGGERVPATISYRQGGALVLVNVCIGGKGPYPFVVDSGSTRSFIDGRLAERLGLQSTGATRQISGIDCSVRATVRRVTSWSVAGMRLSPQTILAVTGHPQQGRHVVGVLGSDIWSRFGELRIDFRRHDLIVRKHEQASPTSPRLVKIPSRRRLPAFLLTGRATRVAPILVQTSPDGALAFAAVRFGAHDPRPLIVDTGAAISLIARDVGDAAHLKLLPRERLEGSLCRNVTAREAESGGWSIVAPPGSPQRSEVALNPQLILIANSAGGGGLLGADQLNSFGSVVLDYSGARLFLGAG